MIVNNANFELTAVKPEQYPVNNIPEVTFVGRSNVGKSSIINSLINRKSLARVGAKPGMTKEINFYNIENKLYFVDLPGYGFAGVSKTTKSSWSKVVETYLATRKQLRLVIMLVDIRHKPSADDHVMYEWLINYDVPHIVVATKSDKLSRSQILTNLSTLRKELNLKENIKLLPYSSENRQGKEELWAQIDSVLLQEESV